MDSVGLMRAHNWPHMGSFQWVPVDMATGELGTRHVPKFPGTWDARESLIWRLEAMHFIVFKLYLTKYRWFNYV